MISLTTDIANTTTSFSTKRSFSQVRQSQAIPLKTTNNNDGSTTKEDENLMSPPFIKQRLVICRYFKDVTDIHEYT